MPSEFDPDNGVLRLRHGTLSVLSRLAAVPTDSSLLDHGVAPLVAELRGLQILTPGGIHPAVAPLAEAIGTAERTFLLEADDHGTVRSFRGWSTPALSVIAMELPGTDEHELMAESPDMLPSLVAELVGLGTAPEPAVTGHRVVDAEMLAALLQRGVAAAPDDVAALLGPKGVEGGWATSLTSAVRGAALRWRLTAAGTWMEVLDAGQSGLWLLEPAGDASDLEPAADAATRIEPTTVAEVRFRLRALLT